MRAQRTLDRHNRHWRACRSRKEPFFWRWGSRAGYVMLEYDLLTIEFDLKDEVVDLLTRFANDMIHRVGRTHQKGAGARAPWKICSFNRTYGFIKVVEEHADEFEEYMRSLIFNRENWAPLKLPGEAGMGSAF